METKTLHSLFLEYGSVCTDTRKIKKNDVFFALRGDNFNGNQYAKLALDNGASYAVIDDKDYFVSDKTILVDDVLKTLQELASYHRAYLNTTIVALTGSNGKTTTKELINIVLSKKYRTIATVGNLNNHIGVPLTLLSIKKDTEIAVVEMGANHQKEIAFLCNIANPDYGLITNYGKAHLEGFGGVQGIIKGKSEMFDHLRVNSKIAFVNSNDSIQLEKTCDIKRITFGSPNSDFPVEFLDSNPFVRLVYNGKEIQSQLIGDYNFSNIAIAIAIGKHFNVDDNDIKAAIESYIPSNNRSQILKNESNQIILDAYNANPTSMEAALKNLSKQEGYKVAILGDMFELGEESFKEHQYIVDLAISLSIDEYVFIGENFMRTTVESDKAKKYVSFEDFKNSQSAIKKQNATILIKGSRGMALERVLEVF